LYEEALQEGAIGYPLFCHSRAGGNPEILHKVHTSEWIPACAGMTEGERTDKKVEHERSMASIAAMRDRYLQIFLWMYMVQSHLTATYVLVPILKLYCV